MSDINGITDKQQLSQYIMEMASEFDTAGANWENRDLKSFLAAMAGWIEGMDGYYLNKDERPPATPTWKTFAEMLRAATVYE